MDLSCFIKLFLYIIYFSECARFVLLKCVIYQYIIIIFIWCTTHILYKIIFKYLLLGNLIFDKPIMSANIFNINIFMWSLQMFSTSLIILLCMFTYTSSMQARKTCSICVLISLRIKADFTASNIKKQSLIIRVEYINEIIRNSCSILKCLACMFPIAIDINIMNTCLRLPTPQVLYLFLLYVYTYNKHIILTRYKSAIPNIMSTETLSICYNIRLLLYYIIFN